MKLIKYFSLTVGVCVLSFRIAAFAQTTRQSDLKTFNEALELIHSHMIGLNKGGDLDQKALQGLVNQLSPAVQLLPTESEKKEDAELSNDGLLCKARLYDTHYLSIRLGKITPETPQALLSEFIKISQSNDLKGIVLDLRDSVGEDYESAAAVASSFIPSGQAPQVFTINNQDYSASPNSADDESKKISALPYILLINGKTSGAPEVLAMILRKTRQTLLIGARTAGGTISFKDFKLSSGQLLRIAVDSVRFQDGSWMLPGGISPDVNVFLSEADEQAYMEDPFTSRRPVYVNESMESSNRVAVRINEAELVKMQNNGTQTDAGQAQKTGESSQPTLNDPVLARAIDLLKTLPFFEKIK
ncbi:MAG TPA: S41 family peptidase [Verrucomicrobiota bacterium]|nr:S41 family peptidase [Verrucomicrobiota bacterium]